MTTKKMKFDIRIKLYEVDDTTQNKYPMEKISVPLHEMFDNFDSADKFLYNTFEHILPFTPPDPNYTHYVHAYVTRPEFKFVNCPVFRYARSFQSFEDAKAFIDKCINVVLSLKEI